MKGLVCKSTGSWYNVLVDGNRMLSCRVRGKLKLEGFNTTNPVAVGDRVVLELEEKAENGIITEIIPRTNYIIRKSIKKKVRGHIIAANLDQILIMVTLAYPRTSLGFIDRITVAAESFRIPVVLLFNKVDILESDGLEYLQELRALYDNIGFASHSISALKNKGISEFQKQLKDRISLLVGHSGVGKSTLINTLSPEVNQRTDDVSDFAQKGVHTTTFAELFTVTENTHIIDTPGIKEYGLIDMEDEELSDYFPEMRALIGECKFHNCMHTQEPGCAIRQAVEQGSIAVTRYHSYLSMLEDEDNRR